MLEMVTEVAIGVLSVFFGMVAIYYLFDSFRIKKRLETKISRIVIISLEDRNTIKGEAKSLSQKYLHNHFESSKHFFNLILDDATDHDIISEDDQRKIIDLYSNYNEWANDEKKRNDELLFSNNEQEVLAACQNVAVFGDESSINILKEILKKWYDNPRVLKQISIAYESILETQ